MSSLRISPLFVFTLLSFCGCPPSGPSPVAPTPDASDASVFVDAAPIPPLDDAALATPATACAHMAKVPGCAVLPDCAATITKINAQPGFKHIDVACLSRATTVAAVTTCGGSCGPAK